MSKLLKDICCLLLGKIRGIMPYQPAFRKYDANVDGPLDPDETVNLLSGSGCHQCDTHQYHLCRKAMTFDELMTARGLVIPQGALSRFAILTGY